MEVIVIGASGAIGEALCNEISTRFPQANVQALSRKSFDVSNENEVESYCKKLKRVDWFINAIGLLHNEAQMIKPEKSLRDFSMEKSLEVFKVNSMISMLWAKHLRRKFPKTTQSVFCTLSAKVGSISDNYLGGWYSYRASKSALNMFLRTIKIEYDRNGLDCKVLGIYPGTTRSKLSEPYLEHTKLKLWDASESAQNILNVILKADSADKDIFYNWTGEKLPY